MSQSIELQKSIAALIAAADRNRVLGVATRLFDHVPPNVVFPFALFASHTSKPLDSINSEDFEHSVVFEILSRYRGMLEAKDILDFFYDTLHRTSFSLSIPVSAYSTFHAADIAQEDDGLTYRATISFSIYTTSNVIS